MEREGKVKSGMRGEWIEEKLSGVKKTWNFKLVIAISMRRLLICIACQLMDEINVVSVLDFFF